MAERSPMFIPLFLITFLSLSSRYHVSVQYVSVICKSIFIVYAIVFYQRLKSVAQWFDHGMKTILP